MEKLLKSLADIFTSGTVASEILVLIVFVTCFLLMIYGCVKLFASLKNTFSSGVDKLDLNKIQNILDQLTSKVDELATTVEAIKQDVTRESIHIENINNELENINESINKVKELHISDAHVLAPIKTNIDNIVSQMNNIQRDLASLHGTVIGLSSNRSNLR
jgi:chromosome segregation ATPase